MSPADLPHRSLFSDHLALVRGGGDLGSGVVASLHRAGFPVIVLEIDRPLCIRRTVSFASAVIDGSIEIEGIPAGHAAGAPDALAAARTRSVGVLVAPELPALDTPPTIVVDARMAKRNIDTSIEDAPFVVALGPGFSAGDDCHAVIETARGHRLGRVIREGSAQPNTGIPGKLGGATTQRVVRAMTAGEVEWTVGIGDIVPAGAVLGEVAGESVVSEIGGVVRGLIAPGTTVTVGTKIADVDPRADTAACFEISDKSRLIGAGVLEAVLTWLNPR